MNKKSFIFRHDFSRNVAILAIGVIFAQAIPVLISPILTRLFSPEDFGLLATFNALCAPLAIIATGRFELAVVIPKQERDAQGLMKISFIIASFFCIGLLLITIPFSSSLSHLFSSPAIKHWLWLLPFSVFLIANLNLLTQWHVRRQLFPKISTTRIFQSIGRSSINITMGFFSRISGALILGTLLGQITSFLLLAKSFYSHKIPIKKVRCLALAKKYRKYPKYMIVGQFFNVLSLQAPVLLLGFFFDTSITGYYMLANKVLIIPSQILGGSIGSVFRQKSAEYYQLNGNCKALFLKTRNKLILLGLLPLIILFFFAEPLFVLIFGAKWIISGEIARYLSVLIFFQLVSSPTSTTIFLPNWQKMELYWQIMRFILSITSFYIGKILGDFKIALLLYVLCFSLLYIIHSFFQYQASKGVVTNAIAGSKPDHQGP